MYREKAKPAVRTVAVAALIFGILGGIFYWWVPLGMILSLAGIVFGFSDWTMARRRSLDYRLSIVAVFISVATLALDFFIAALGWQTFTFGR
jgi:hypothetical protein